MFNLFEQKNIMYYYMKLNQFLLSYCGNKYLETRKYLGDHIKGMKTYDIIAEPFCGIFGFSRAFFEVNPDFDGEIWLNDIDGRLIKILEQLKDNPNEQIECLKEELKKYSVDKELSNDKNKSHTLKLITNTLNCRLCSIDQGTKKLNAYQNKLEDYKKFFSKVRLFNLNCKDFLKLIPKDKKTFIYFDPPYFNSSNEQYDKYVENDKSIYKDGTSIYIDILNIFKDAPPNMNCMMVMNKIDVINFIFKEYFHSEYQGKYQNLGKNKKHHIIYAN